MNKIFTISFYVLITFIAISCTKNTDKFTPYATSELNDVSWANGSMDIAKSQAIINALKKNGYSGSFNASIGTTVDFNNQIQLQLPANSYLSNGVNFTDVADFKLLHLAKKGDYIRNLLSSCNSNVLYDTKSIFLVSMSDKNQNALTIKSSNSYSTSLVDSNLVHDYKFLVGNIVTEGEINWKLADSLENGYLQTNTIVLNGVSKQAYQVFNNQFNWINISKPINSTIGVNSNVVLSANNFTNKNTAVFALLDDYTTVLKLQSDFASKSFVAKNLPLGSKVTLVSISLIDGQFYLGKQNIIVSNSVQYSIKPSLVASSLSGVNLFLDEL